MRVASPRWLPGLSSGPLPRGAGVFRASRRRGLPGMGAGGSLGAREEGSRSAREGARGGDGAGRRGSEAGSSGDKARTWQVQVLPSGSDQGSSGEERRD